MTDWSLQPQTYVRKVPANKGHQMGVPPGGVSSPSSYRMKRIAHIISLSRTVSLGGVCFLPQFFRNHSPVAGRISMVHEGNMMLFSEHPLAAQSAHTEGGAKSLAESVV